jgi:hypothetical protein
MNFFIWLKNTNFGTAVRESIWIYPTFEIVHLFGIALLVGSIAMTDVRLLGVSKRLPVNLTAQHLLPWTWVGFALVVISGVSLFAGFPTDYYVNTAFRIKLLLIAFAGVNAALFHWRVYRNVASWNENLPSPFAARAFAIVSIVLWFSTIAAGRLIAYTGSGKD